MNRESDRREPTGLSASRREFLKKAAARSLLALGVTAAVAAVTYETPRLKSFLPEVTAYAQTTGAGKFTLKGTT